MTRELALDAYYQAKLRTIEVLREASDRQGVRLDSVVIDSKRPAANAVENHVVKLLSCKNGQLTVTIRHDVFIDKDRFFLYATPLLEDAIKKLAN
jgi:hypothetical protein